MLHSSRNGNEEAEPQEISVHANSNGQSIEIKLRVELRKAALPQ